MEPKAYKVRFIEPGIISYEDKNAGTVLVSKEALDRMAQSFKGCPVIFIPEQHNSADKSNAFNLDDPNAAMPAGIVAEMPEWGDDGWMWVNLLVWDEDAIDAFDNKKFNVSCSYMTDEEGPGGTWHELPYDAEVVNGHYMHMAIVPRPRYEGSRVFANSKGGQMKAFFKKNAAAEPDKKPDPVAPVEPDTPAAEPDEKKVLENVDGTEVDVNGTRVPLSELIANFEEKRNAAPEGESDLDGGEEIPPETEVPLPSGGMVTVGELIAAFTEEPEAPEAPEMENACATGVKANSARVPAKKTVNKVLQNAATGGNVFAVDTPMTRRERAELGRKRYGLGKEKGGEA